MSWDNHIRRANVIHKSWPLRPRGESATFWISSSSERIEKRMRCRCRRKKNVFVPERAPLPSSWPVRGPTWTTRSSITCRRAFFFFLTLKKSLLFPLVCFCEPYFNTRYVRACCRRASAANAAQQDAISPTLSSKASTCRALLTARCILKTSEENRKSARPWTKHNHSKQLKLVWCAKDLPLFPISIRYNIAPSLRPSYVFRTCMRRPDCFTGALSSWIFVNRQFAPKIVDLSVRVIHVLFYIFFLVSKRSGGNSANHWSSYV